MDDRLDEHTWNGTPMCRGAWVDAMSSVGLQYRFASSHSGTSTHHSTHAGQSVIVDLDIAWQSASPIVRCGDDEHLFVQVVRSGMRRVEQRGQTMTFGPGDVAVLDPLAWYDASVRERTRMSILRIPRSALRERGLRHRFPVVCCPDRASPDVCAVRDFVLNAASQAGKASEPMLARFGDQCLDLMDVLINDCSGAVSARSTAVTALRAKQLIARHIADPDLSAARIAAELHMSTSSLTRALQANGLSAMRYAWSLRIEHAARRLRADAPHGAIKAIAYQCGFTNHAHFSRAFKARYDMTPREYAASHKTARSEAAQQTQTCGASGLPDVRNELQAPLRGETVETLSAVRDPERLHAMAGNEH
ncbi:helix-turn-helix domain-containing protein [Paraburkholderia solisilvae]|uniref:HTH-type transcriptional activator RhaS n=1 Tax=Paraburkholderia solisilvae TaxID=624376 RepID=A0A6J5DQK5_9BURK|nr:helix-turn-helix domain-containing protein [Paraburkholderia solisilvae]CAB3756580.1 HTH-type transcriptional activator RhaS [Paraburkholderia solisilvae]